jgi:hypothetical protein
MGVKCVFYVAEVTKVPLSEGRKGGKIKLTATAKGPYKKWSEWTPTGEFTMSTTNPAATAWFEENLGADVAITIERATEADLLAE